MKKEEMRITFGGWYQRTTLHLTEIYEFLAKAESKLNLKKSRLIELRKKLNLKSISHEFGYLECIRAITKDGIEIRYYEDGLYVLETFSTDIAKSSMLLKNYFEEKFKPAMDYIFSLGAPTPKILSNIKDEHIFVVAKIDTNHSHFEVDKKFGEVYSKGSYRDISVYKTNDYIFLLASPHQEKNLNVLTEMQIFFRDFKYQLQKYLNIHRKIWEEISEIKEKRYVQGKEVLFYKTKLESYKKTIDLISSRINQMSAYAHTRASLAKDLDIQKNLVMLFQYRFEDLFNTLEYIKEIWVMTVNYVNSAVKVFSELDNKQSMSGIRSIQILASIGVIGAFIGYLTRDTINISKSGLILAAAIVFFTLFIDFIIRKFSKNKKYELSFVELERGI